MSGVWKSVEIFVREGLSTDEVKEAVRGQILRTASECGDFVRRIKVGEGVHHSEGWLKWNASYLPGPPGVFRG